VGRPGLSDAGFDLLGGLLALDPARRITAKAAEQHAWCARGPTRAAALRLFPTSCWSGPWRVRIAVARPRACLLATEASVGSVHHKVRGWVRRPRRLGRLRRPCSRRRTARRLALAMHRQRKVQCTQLRRTADSPSHPAQRNVRLQAAAAPTPLHRQRNVRLQAAAAPSRARRRAQVPGAPAAQRHMQPQAAAAPSRARRRAQVPGAPAAQGARADADIPQRGRRRAAPQARAPPALARPAPRRRRAAAARARRRGRRRVWPQGRGAVGARRSLQQRGRRSLQRSGAPQPAVASLASSCTRQRRAGGVAAAGRGLQCQAHRQAAVLELGSDLS